MAPAEKKITLYQKIPKYWKSSSGDIDILWLDGGQVRPQNGQDIQLSRIAEEARKYQPGLITADRTVGGENENYITPENRIPDHVIKAPWESCLTVGSTWIYRYSDTYKSSRELVKMLVETVSKGGNLALGVGPQPDGRLPAEAMKELLGLGEWLKVNGDAIYGTRALDVAEIDNVMYTKKGDSVYAIIALEEGEALGEKIFIPINKDIAKVTCLGSEYDVAFTKTENGIFVSVPERMVGTSPYAVAFKLN
jgi:alpha-L-fucosidase